ncbi:unnamed protein product [Closterium sp. NIES-64]|nr:unnamed protein product [Closterium sp. NIES-64]
MSESSAATATATVAGVSLEQRRAAADATQPSVAPDAGNAKDTDALKDKAKPRGASPRRRSGWLVLVLVVLVAAAAGAGYYLRREYSEYIAIDDDGETEIQQKLWSAEELAKYNGSTKGLPLLLGILGDVFDVTKGRKHYGKGQGYNHFAGRSEPQGATSELQGARDATRAFVSGNFSGDGLTDDLTGLSGEQCIGIADWRDFYFKTYIHVGKLVGRFYDEQGKAKDVLGEFDELLKEGKRQRDVATAGRVQ